MESPWSLTTICQHSSSRTVLKFFLHVTLSYVRDSVKEEDVAVDKPQYLFQPLSIPKDQLLQYTSQINHLTPLNQHIRLDHLIQALQSMFPVLQAIQAHTFLVQHQNQQDQVTHLLSQPNHRIDHQSVQQSLLIVTQELPI
uniref:Uncharacterized protein n=1 Tax=Cacopsylla melanoneura TaxID=428564 RepID=A0A8D9AAT5_9HEMI